MNYLEISELYHHGIKDQKWGVRRYQNYDGTLTPEGKERYNKGAKEVEELTGKEVRAEKGADGNYYYTDKNGDKQLFKTRVDQLSDKELADLNTRIKLENSLAKETSDAYEYHGPHADQALRDASRLANDLSNAIPKGTGKTVKKDYSNLSDQELRTRIQRLQLEDSYGKLTGDTKYVKSGGEVAREFLQSAGALLAVASSAAALALTIKKIREPKAGQSDILDEDENSLEHHGVKGQKWGLRRYQNPDGSLTPEGQVRYGGKTHISELSNDELADLDAANRMADEEERKSENTKKVLKIGAIVIGTAVVAAGAAFIASKLSKSKTTEEINKNINIKKTETIEKRKHTLEVNNKFKQEWEMKWGMRYPGKNAAKGIENLIIQNGNNNAANIISKSLFAKHSDGLTDNYLAHHGVKGQKWGVRRYQDESGALTPEGRRRYRTDLGTKEILDNSSDYSKLTRDKQRKYAEYGRRAGAKRGFLTGLAGGAMVGLGKTALDVYFKKSEGNLSNASARSIVNSFTRNMMLGALGGSVVGTLVGSVAGKKSAQAKLADRGREYVDELLNTPTDRIRGR